MDGAFILLPLLSILCSPALWIVLGRPKWLRSSAGHPITDEQSVSIVIPARNEEHNIGRLLRSLQNQTCPSLETIVVNDGSTDRTEKVSLELGATVVDPGKLPAGWLGKPWACHQGALRARGSWLLFLDADLELEPNSLETLQQLVQNKPSAYSICPYHTINKPYEELSSFFNVLMLAGSNAFSRIRHRTRSLFGQTLLVSKEHYEQIGTHRSVRDQVLENFQLTREFQRHEIPCSSLLGKGLITMRMFPEGPGQLCESWQKGFTTGATQSEPKALLYCSIWISGLMFILTSLALLPFPFTGPAYFAATGAAYLLGVLQCTYAFRLAGNFSFLNALLFPITLLFYQGLFFISLIKKKMGIRPDWKGRKLD